MDQKGEHTIRQYCIRFILLILIINLIPGALYSQDAFQIDSLNASLKYAEEDSSKINILLDLSNLYMTNDFEEALNYANQALDLSEEIGKVKCIAKANLQIGNIYTNAGDYDAAMENLMKTLSILGADRPTAEHYRTYLILGVLYDRIFNYDEALEYYFKALNISNELKRRGEYSNLDLREQTLFNNIGNIYSTRNENETAIEYYQKGVELALMKEDKYTLGILYNNLGKIHDKLGLHDSAYVYLIKSLTARQEDENLAGIAKSYYFLAGHFMDIEDYETALEYAEKSRALGEEVGSLQTQYTAFWFLYNISNELKRYKNAVDFHVKYKELGDSLYNNNTLKEITRLKMQHDYDARETIRELENQKTRLRFVIIVAALVFGMLILGFIIILSRLKSKRISLENDNLEKDIELKNKELATNVMYMVRKNEMINNVAKKLLDLKEVAADKNKKPIQDIVLELQSEADQRVWKEFEMRFQQVHKEFYENLLAKHPDLTPSESRLVALLRLNMTTKEIAAITHQNMKSVDVARARLRKKLNLTGTDTNLVAYLTSL